jgi:hypothetical protein
MATSLHGSIRRHSCGLLIILLCASFGCSVSPPAPKPTGPVQVVGTLTLMVGAGDFPSPTAVPTNLRIELPDVDVYLRNAVSGTSGIKGKTQLDSKFARASVRATPERLLRPDPGAPAVRLVYRDGAFSREAVRP